MSADPCFINHDVSFSNTFWKITILWTRILNRKHCIWSCKRVFLLGKHLIGCLCFSITPVFGLAKGKGLTLEEFQLNTILPTWLRKHFFVHFIVSCFIKKVPIVISLTAIKCSTTYLDILYNVIKYAKNLNETFHKKTNDHFLPLAKINENSSKIRYCSWICI